MSLTLSTPPAASVSSTQQVSSLQQGWGLEGQCHSCAAAHWLLLPLSGLSNAGHLLALSEIEQRSYLWQGEARFTPVLQDESRVQALHATPSEPPLCHRSHTRPKRVWPGRNCACAAAGRRGLRPFPPPPGPRKPRSQGAHALPSAPNGPREPGISRSSARA